MGKRARSTRSVRRFPHESPKTRQKEQVKACKSKIDREKNKKKVRKRCIFTHESAINIYGVGEKPMQRVGVDGAEGPPVPIPNTEVKLSSAEDTWLATAWENREMPTQIILNSSVGRACGC